MTLKEQLDIGLILFKEYAKETGKRPYNEADDIRTNDYIDWLEQKVIEERQKALRTTNGYQAPASSDASGPNSEIK